MTDTTILHEKGIQLSDREKNFLAKSSWSKAKEIRAIIKRYKSGMTYYEMMKTLEQVHGAGNVNIDTVRGRMTQLTGSKDAPKSFEDKYGRYPLVKTDEKRLNPETETYIHVYAWNERYGQPLTHREIVAKQQDQGQMNFHGDLFEGRDDSRKRTSKDRIL